MFERWLAGKASKRLQSGLSITLAYVMLMSLVTVIDWLANWQVGPNHFSLYSLPLGGPQPSCSGGFEHRKPTINDSTRSVGEQKEALFEMPIKDDLAR